jgi:F-type H+-transporting ATPase subunit a
VSINWNGKRRWIALLLVIFSIYVMLNLPPVIPVIQLPGEVWPGVSIFGLPVTNTLFGSVIVWILIVLLLLYVSRARPKSGAEVPRSGFYNFFEMLYEGLYGFIEGIAGGPYIKTIFSFFMTIFVLVLLSNWLEITPGVDSIGFLEPHVRINADTGAVEPENGGFETMQSGGVYVLNPKCPWVSPDAAKTQTAEAQAARAEKGCITGTGAEVPASAPVSTEGGEPHFAPGDPNVPWVVLPFVRTPSTDLNMTVALALIAVVSIQVMGFRALGFGYINKFLPLKNLITKPVGVMDVAIGLLELIGEIAKILSFSFRLLGNLFAGSILLFVISFLVPAVVPWALFLFEFGVAILQALIFGMLTAIFMNSATASHHAEEH